MQFGDDSLLSESGHFSQSGFPKLSGGPERCMLLRAPAVGKKAQIVFSELIFGFVLFFLFTVQQ